MDSAEFNENLQQDKHNLKSEYVKAIYLVKLHKTLNYFGFDVILN